MAEKADRKVVKKIDTFGNGEIFAFENPGDTLDVSITNYRPDVITKLGAVDIVDGIDLDTGKEVAFFVSAGLKAYRWGEMIGDAVRVEFTGEVQNPRSGRTFKAFDVYQLEV